MESVFSCCLRIIRAVVVIPITMGTEAQVKDEPLVTEPNSLHQARPRAIETSDSKETLFNETTYSFNSDTNIK